MRYFALYQRDFTWMPRTLAVDSHIFVDYTTADDLEEVFAQFQAEVMTEERRCRVLFRFVRHISMSVGDIVIDEAGSCFTVMPVGFKRAMLGTLEARTELALHLLLLGLEGTPGWAGLFGHDPALLTAAIVNRLRNDAYGVGSYARKPYQFPRLWKRYRDQARSTAATRDASARTQGASRQSAGGGATLGNARREARATGARQRA